MTERRQSFDERYERFKDRFQLEPSSYQIRNEDGNPGGWIAQIQIWEDETDSSTVTPFWPTASKVYPSEDVANAAALWGGLQWLEEGRPPVKVVS